MRFIFAIVLMFGAISKTFGASAIGLYNTTPVPTYAHLMGGLDANGVFRPMRVSANGEMNPATATPTPTFTWNATTTRTQPPTPTATATNTPDEWGSEYVDAVIALTTPVITGASLTFTFSQAFSKYSLFVLRDPLSTGVTLSATCTPVIAPAMSDGNYFIGTYSALTKSVLSANSRVAYSNGIWGTTIPRSKVINLYLSGITFDGFVGGASQSITFRMFGSN